jgi:hypothetical protein
LDRTGWGEARSRGAVIAFPQDRERIAFHRRGSGHSYLLYKNVMFTISDHQYIGKYNGKCYVVSKSGNNIKEYLPETNSIIDTILFNKANDNHTSYIDELTGRGVSFDHTGNVDFFQIDENGTFVQTGTVDVVLRNSAEIVCFTGVDEGDYLFYGTNYDGKYYSNYDGVKLPKDIDLYDHHGLAHHIFENDSTIIIDVYPNRGYNRKFDINISVRGEQGLESISHSETFTIYQKGRMGKGDFEVANITHKKGNMIK